MEEGYDTSTPILEGLHFKRDKEKGLQMSPEEGREYRQVPSARVVIRMGPHA